MTGSAAYLQKLADRYQALAATMRTEKDRESIEQVAAQYQQLADEAEQREGERAAYGDAPTVISSAE